MGCHSRSMQHLWQCVSWRSSSHTPFQYGSRKFCKLCCVSRHICCSWCMGQCLEDEKLNGREKFEKESWIQLYTFHEKEHCTLTASLMMLVYLFGPSFERLEGLCHRVGRSCRKLILKMVGKMVLRLSMSTGVNASGHLNIQVLRYIPSFDFVLLLGIVCPGWTDDCSSVTFTGNVICLRWSFMPYLCYIFQVTGNFGRYIVLNLLNICLKALCVGCWSILQPRFFLSFASYRDYWRQLQKFVHWSFLVQEFCNCSNQSEKRRNRIPWSLFYHFKSSLWQEMQRPTSIHITC